MSTVRESKVVLGYLCVSVRQRPGGEGGEEGGGVRGDPRYKAKNNNNNNNFSTDSPNSKTCKSVEKINFGRVLTPLQVSTPWKIDHPPTQK